MSDDAKYIGLSEEEATRLAHEDGMITFVCSVDGKFFIGTTDYRLDRINLHFTNGKVSSTDRG